MESKLDEIPWFRAVSLSIDRTSSVIAVHNSLVSRCRGRNPEMYVVGCPCHLVHTTASHVHDAFAQIAGVHVEDLLIDESTKQEGVLAEYTNFCNQEYAKLLKS